LQAFLISLLPLFITNLIFEKAFVNIKNSNLAPGIGRQALGIRLSVYIEYCLVCLEAIRLGGWKAWVLECLEARRLGSWKVKIRDTEVHRFKNRI